ncbi:MULTISPECIES: hypothetical protein [Sphingomonas]|uniref:DUF2178 domain-containing protein n=1 Tax=Sphingomonas leidyi TaxID=68569 RepID=A0A7X5ZU93_9SPHN|nr:MULTISPECIES: hypothetical protein [Sphingomonas]MBN8811903.1 hypothetical protein [Sphingomonas sp.]NIJ63464.1 hypothetical protein [Sphingomonas leidyi]OJY48439.1 MAG: hypothetical protein BGP17_01275 [Sphingomonas sp. 67-41]
MPFKEKIAWISVVTTILVWGGFFGFMLTTGGKLHGAVYFTGFIAAVIVQTILATGAAIVTAALAPADAGAGSDERDRDIARRAYALAYPVLIGLVFCVAGSVHLGFDRIDMAYAIMGAIVIAEIVHYAAQIAGYRRGN